MADNAGHETAVQSPRERRAKHAAARLRGIAERLAAHGPVLSVRREAAELQQILRLAVDPARNHRLGMTPTHRLSCSRLRDRIIKTVPVSAWDELPGPDRELSDLCEHAGRMLEEAQSGQASAGMAGNLQALAAALEAWPAVMRTALRGGICAAVEGAEPEDRPPMGDYERIIWDHLLSLPEGEGRTGRQIIKFLAAVHGFVLSQSTLTSGPMAFLQKHYGVKNRRGGVGYYVPTSARRQPAIDQH